LAGIALVSKHINYRFRLNAPPKRHRGWLAAIVLSRVRFGDFFDPKFLIVALEDFSELRIE
jgi:hypothetical protein